MKKTKKYWIIQEERYKGRILAPHPIEFHTTIDQMFQWLYNSVNPLDWYLYLNEIVQSIDWDQHCAGVGIPLGISLNALLFVCTIFIDSSDQYKFMKSTKYQDIFRVDYQEIQMEQLKLMGKPIRLDKADKNALRKSMIGIVIQLFWLVLLLLSILITLRVASQRKRYSFLNKDSEELVNSESANLVDLNEKPSTFYQELKNWRKLFKSQKIDNYNQENLVWCVDAWKPSSFTLTVASLYNPINAFILGVLKPLSTQSVLLLVLTTWFINATVKWYQQRLIDETLIWNEIAKETGMHSFPHKKLRDAAVDATLPSARHQVLVTPHYINESKMFDVRGK